MGGGCGIGGTGDGASDDQDGGSVGDGVGGGGDAFLVSDGAACGANSGDDQEGIGAGGGAYGGNLFSGADHAVDAGLFREFCEAEDLIGGGGGDADAG